MNKEQGSLKRNCRESIEGEKGMMREKRREGGKQLVNGRKMSRKEREEIIE